MSSPERANPEGTAWVRGQRETAGSLVVELGGRLDADGVAATWNEAMGLLAGAAGAPVVLDASGVDYCDGAGATLLVTLQRQAPGAELRGLRGEFAGLLELVRPQAEEPQGERRREPLVEVIGRSALDLGNDLRACVAFTGELGVMLVRSLREPRKIRFDDVILIAQRAGIGAIPVITLVGFLLGLILAFQSAIPMRRFGAEIFVADLLGISMLRELGPLMASILLAARSGSAFAAELGTMKVNEEIDALSTMGLEPVRFLVVPRVIAALIVVPVLAMLVNIAGLAGGAVVMLSLDIPLVTYVNRVIAATTLTDFAGGLGKALVFGMIVAGVGCMRGLQAGQGADAVGLSTTSAVVSGIVLIAFADGIFAVAFYLLGI
jgi:phospholipid/cholesterol/gamma-HCH transport system permease protein